MQYRWEIRTGDTWQAGTDANVYLSLSGSLGAMKELELNDPDTNNDWEKGDVNHGGFETNDLGNVTSGTLRHDGAGAGSDWTVDYVRITNNEDGRIWLAGINGELAENAPKRLGFQLTDKGQYDQMQQAKRDAQQKALGDADAAEQATQDEADAREAAAEEKRYQKALQEQKKTLQRELQKAKMDAELAKLKAQIAQTQAPPVPASVPAQAGALRTVELFGVVNGSVVPLTQAVLVTPGAVQVTPGARVMRGDVPTDGYGLGGTPGRWSSFVSESPAAYGLPATIGVIGSDGSRGHVLSAQFLQLLFGSGWMAVIS